MSKWIKNLQPFLCPFFRAIGPRPSPFSPAPRITDHDKALAFAFHGSEDGVCVTTNEALHSDILEAITCVAQVIEGAGEEAVLVGSKELFMPEFIGVKNVLY